MNEKMTLLFVKKTGHVLALLTRAADPDAATTPDELTGGELLVRYVGDTTRTWIPDARFFVPADELDTKTVDFDASVLASPRAFFLDEDKNVQPLDLTESVSNAVPPAAGNTTQIRVTVSAGVASETAVWLHITNDDPTRTQTRTGETATPPQNTDINVSQLTPGTYYVLALVAGVPPNAFTFNIP